MNTSSIIRTLIVFISVWTDDLVTAFTIQPQSLGLRTNFWGLHTSQILKVKNDVGNNGETKLQKPKIQKSMPIHDVNGPVKPRYSIDEFLHAIENAPQGGIVVVQYHAKWCKVCARVVIKMRQMAQRLQSKGTPVPVSFISVEVTANNEICTTLNIKKFPFVQMYRNGECIASFGTGPAHNFQRAVGGTLDEKLSLTEEKWESFRSEFKTNIAEVLAQFETLRLSRFYDENEVSQKIEKDVAP